MKLNIEGEQKEDFISIIESGLVSYEDGSIDEIVCENYIHRCDNLVSLIEQINRVLKSGGKAVLTSPYYASFEATLDPRTKRVISEATFLNFNKEWREKNLKGVEINTDFDYVCGYVFSPDWEARSEEAKAFAVKHYNNVIKGLQTILTKK